MRSTIFSAIYFSCLPLLALTASAQTCSPLGDVKITFFGWPDNSPPGAGIAWTKCGHSVAGGTGSYDDPITFATATDGDFAVCDIVYLPYVKKYARYEDDCEQCSEPPWVPQIEDFIIVGRSDWNNRDRLGFFPPISHRSLDRLQHRNRRISADRLRE